MEKPRITKGLVAFVIVEAIAAVMFTAVTIVVFYKQVTTDPVFVYIGDMMSGDISGN